MATRKRQPVKPAQSALRCTCGMKFTCDECRGRGRDPANPVAICDVCDGAGSYERTCPVHGLHGHGETSEPRENPYRTEHAARQLDPRQFRSFGRKTVFHGSGDNRKAIYFVIGGYSPPRSGSAVQSVRFPADEWTVEQAQEWLRSHGMSTVVEAAVPYEDQPPKAKVDLPSTAKSLPASLPKDPKKTPTEKERNPFSTGEHHATIIQNLTGYTRFTESIIKSKPDGDKTVKFILGWKSKEDQPDVTRVMFPANEWSKEQAAVWLKQHNMPAYVTAAAPDIVRCPACRHAFMRDPNIPKVIDQYTCPNCGKVPRLADIQQDVDRSAAWKQKQAANIKKREEEKADRMARLRVLAAEELERAKAEGREFNADNINIAMLDRDEDEDEDGGLEEPGGPSQQGEEGEQVAAAWLPKPPPIRENPRRSLARSIVIPVGQDCECAGCGCELRAGQRAVGIGQGNRVLAVCSLGCATRVAPQGL